MAAGLEQLKTAISKMPIENAVLLRYLWLVGGWRLRH